MLRGNYIPVNGKFRTFKTHYISESAKALGKVHNSLLVPTLSANGIVGTTRKANIRAFNPLKPDCGCEHTLAAMAGLFVSLPDFRRLTERQLTDSIIFVIS